MTPSQHRALEALAEAGDRGLVLARDLPVPPGRIHPMTARALERRRLAVIEPVVGTTHDEAAWITVEGRQVAAKAAR